MNNNVKIYSGKCGVCGSESEFFLKSKFVLYREAQCNICGAALRNSDLAHSLVKKLIHKDSSIAENLNELRNFKILEASAFGPIHNALKSSESYSCFEYFDEIKPGAFKDGIKCDNLESLSDADDKFDVVITQDVLEHVGNPGKAFSEIHRVLKMGGYHIFTVPYHENEKTKDRKNLLKVYHGDQLREDGYIVNTDWGNDLVSIINQYGFETELICKHKWHPSEEISSVDNEYLNYILKPALEYFKYNSWIVVSKKNKRRV